jgi:uncharacterized repeat protein (TIGR03837 family)
MTGMPAEPWDLFCRVIDNHGDAGVCWRLAADLAERGERVRLWIDDTSSIAWMAPQGAAGVQVLQWPQQDPGVEPGSVVVEAFGCELPDFFVARMARAEHPPLWINLEYLSAESFVERSHKLPSPQLTGPGAGLQKWFFYPGFTRGTGGLLRERDLRERQRAFDAPAWLGSKACTPEPGERVVSLFCYEQTALPAWLDLLAQQPTLLLATAGHAARQVAAALGPSLRRGKLRALPLPLLAQRDYDHLLWASDLNFVRGEDSFVRAQWAAKPFIWHIYPQQDGVHLDKLDAFLSLYLSGADAALAVEARRLCTTWNTSASPPAALPAADAWQQLATGWRDELLGQVDLATQLLGFVAETR